MRLSSYLVRSRHGIFYYRWPIPSNLHPQEKRTDLKVSLGTRCPETAKLMSRLLTVAGHSLAMSASVQLMKYEDIRRHVREHYVDLLEAFKDRVSETGPVSEDAQSRIAAAQGLSEGLPEYWASLTNPEGVEGVLSAFCDARGIAMSELSGDDKSRLLEELHKGNQAYLKAVLEHNASFDTFDLVNSTERTAAPAEIPTIDATPYDDVVDRYFKEIERAGSHAAKTESEKRDALKLLGQITSQKSPALITKADAQKVKDILLRLPKNRSTSAQTRGLSLEEMLELENVAVISARTVNAYISAMQTFMRWSLDNGYATENPFIGMRVKVSKKVKDQAREAFSTEQLQILFRHLTENPDRLVRKDEHKWGVLIGMFTGMRLNEVAQLEVNDIKIVDGVWCIDATEDGDNNKRLKNSSSHRRVPVHQKLLDCGFLEFVETQRGNSTGRLFPKLSYSAQNGYGRNIGRWFNEKLLPALDMKHPGLVYHSLRHSMITRLNHSDVQETRVKAIVGHSQSGVTFDIYFKDGFKPDQLKAAIDQFSF